MYSFFYLCTVVWSVVCAMTVTSSEVFWAKIRHVFADTFLTGEVLDTELYYITIGSPETRVFILVVLARVNMSHWFNIMTSSKILSRLAKKANIFGVFVKIFLKLCWGHPPGYGVIFFKSN